MLPLQTSRQLDHRCCESAPEQLCPTSTRAMLPSPWEDQLMEMNPTAASHPGKRATADAASQSCSGETIQTQPQEQALAADAGGLWCSGPLSQPPSTPLPALEDTQWSARSQVGGHRVVAVDTCVPPSQLQGCLCWRAQASGSVSQPSGLWVNMLDWLMITALKPHKCFQYPEMFIFYTKLNSFFLSVPLRKMVTNLNPEWPTRLEVALCHDL